MREQSSLAEPTNFENNSNVSSG